MNNLTDCLGIKAGVIAFVGSGGKTTTIYTLARELYSQGKKVIVTTTTKMYIPRETEVQATLLAPTVIEIENMFKTKGIIAVGVGQLENKMLGITEELVVQLAKEADYILVEADGAKHYPIKVPAQHEPVIPKCSKQVVIVVGMSALGRRIESACFRQSEVEALLGVDRRHKLTIVDMVKIIQSPCGLSKGSNEYDVSLLLNQIDKVEDKASIENLVNQLKEVGMRRIVMASVQQQEWKQA